MSKKRPIQSAANKPVPNWLINISWAAVLLVSVVLSLKSLTEPDIFWQLRTGEWIVKNGAVPTHDIFSYTLNGTPWINVKWFYEVLIYVMQCIGGAEFVLVLQAIVTVLILIIIRKIYNTLYESIYLKKPSHTSPFLILSLLLTLICISFRLNGRPEMFSHLFTAAYIFILLKNRIKKSNLIYAIIPLQILWTNLHEGYGTGIVILFIFNTASLAQVAFQKLISKKKYNFDWRLLLVTCCSVLAMAVSPYGLKMITHPIEIYSQLNVNKYTTELVSFTDSSYWTFQSYLNIALFILAVICLFLNYTQSKDSRFQQFTKNFGWDYSALLTAFFILSLTANRNIPFSAIICCPLIAIGFKHRITSHLKRKKVSGAREIMFMRRSYLITILVSALLYFSIVTNKFYSWTKSHSTYGLQIDALYHPSGAANFVKENNITGTCFSDYLTSSYLLWSLQPNFKTFIDLRDLDVFPVSFFEQFAAIVNDSTAFEKADSQYHFDYIVLYRNQFQPLHNYLSHSRYYEMVFVDAVAAVYVKREEQFKAVIKKYGFNNGANDIFSNTQRVKPGGLAADISVIFNPFFEPRDYSDVDFNFEAAKFYFNASYYSLAYKHIRQSLHKNSDNADAQDMLGNISLGYLQQSKGDEAQEYLSIAGQAFNTALTIDSKNEQALKGLGECALVNSNTDEAISFFQKCLAINQKNTDTWAALADAYEDLSNSDVTNSKNWLLKRIDCLNKMNDMHPNNAVILVELAYTYYKTGDCFTALNYIHKIKDFNRFPPVVRADLLEVLSHCNGSVK